ncbi:MAG: cytochrome C [Flavobacteriales bacterium]|nr:cytochrome C [Flavobacteriales bacterium]|tara:strand:- start:251 stop:841 length:591 start_codon:yes stop_codon:yes gene_type:complete
MMKNIYAYIFIISIACIALLSSCSNNEDGKPGYEFMPDMYRSPSLEIYSSNSFFKDSLNARLPVAGTIPRGFIPFDYDNNLEDYLLAGNQLKNPFKYSDENIEKGKKLYQMFCAHCHGKNGDGKGSITHPVYGAIPSYSDDVMIRRTGENMNDLAAGHIYHAIYYGLNAMGPHNSQINDTERWLITMYVQELQKGN